MMKTLSTCCALFFVLVPCFRAFTEDAYYSIPLRSLTLSEGKLEDNYEWGRRSWQIAETLQPYTIMDGDAEAYIAGGLQSWGLAFENSFLFVRAGKGSLITG